MTSFQLQFSCHHEKTWFIPIKMAGNRSENINGSGRAKVLLDAMAFFANQRGGGVIGRGRAGMSLFTQVRAPYARESSRQEVCPGPHERAWALSVLEPGPGGLSSWRGRSHSPPVPTTPPTTPPRPARSRGGRGLSLPVPDMPP